MGIDNVDALKGESTSELRAQKILRKEQDIQEARRLKDMGYSNVSIANVLGVDESTVRKWFRKD